MHSCQRDLEELSVSLETYLGDWNQHLNAYCNHLGASVTLAFFQAALNLCSPIYTQICY